MWTLLKRVVLGFLFDESAFQRYCGVLAYLVGLGMEQGIIPTGIADGGNKYGWIPKVLAFYIAAGARFPRLRSNETTKPGG